MGEALISKGLATVVRYGQTDDRRASDYDLLLAAEAKAQKSLKGIYGKKESGTAMQHVVDITGVRKSRDMRNKRSRYTSPM